VNPLHDLVPRFDVFLGLGRIGIAGEVADQVMEGRGPVLGLNLNIAALVEQQKLDHLSTITPARHHRTSRLRRGEEALFSSSSSSFFGLSQFRFFGLSPGDGHSNRRR